MAVCALKRIRQRTQRQRRFDRPMLLLQIRNGVGLVQKLSR